MGNIASVYVALKSSYCQNKTIELNTTKATKWNITILLPYTIYLLILPLRHLG